MDLLEQFLGQINMNRGALNRKTYIYIYIILVSSTQAGEYIRSMEGDREADCDSMVLVSLRGKQTVVCTERGQQHSTSADGWVGSAHDTEITLTDVEQQKHLLAYDLGLGETDAAFHSPLLTIANMPGDEKQAHPASSIRITATRTMARQECQLYAAASRAPRDPARKAGPSPATASR